VQENLNLHSTESDTAQCATSVTRRPAQRDTSVTPHAAQCDTSVTRRPAVAYAAQCDTYVTPRAAQCGTSSGLKTRKVSFAAPN
jgi:hypothetical protein